MSTPFRLPELVGRKHVVASAVQEIPQFECNKLHVEKHIGRGSFGEVFLTEFRNTDKEPAEKVVVKRMLEMQDEEDTKRFIKEVRIINELKHPNIVEFRWSIYVLVSCHSEVVVISPLVLFKTSCCVSMTRTAFFFEDDFFLFFFFFADAYTFEL